MRLKNLCCLAIVLVVASCQARQEAAPGSFTQSRARIEGLASDTTIAAVDAAFFGETSPLLGRSFTAQEYAVHSPVVIISYRFWTDRLGGRPDVIGSAIKVNDLPSTMVGVMPENFDRPAGVVLWTPR
jgi:hypothetical protein